MNDYPFETITINKRDVPLRDIVSQSVLGETEFEQETFSFLQQWMSGTSSFEFQTSGSTGNPKVISFTRDQLIQSATATIKALGLTEGSTALVCVNTKYVAGKMMLVRACINRMKIFAVEPSSTPMEKIPHHRKIDFAAMVPLQMDTMIREGFNKRLNTINTIIIGGAAISNDLRLKIKSTLNTHVYATYGMTETITHVALQDLRGAEDVFTILPNIKITQDTRSCLVIQAPYLPAPVVTNDLVQLISADSFKWLGRIDNIINSGGIKISPEKVEIKVEAIFKRLNINQRLMVAGIPDEILGSKIVLLVEGAPLPPDLVSSLLGELNHNIERFEIPRQIIAVKRFIMTKTGKINRPATLQYVKL